MKGTAVATATGIFETSTVVEITVEPPTPTVSITNPVGGSVLSAPVNITIAAGLPVGIGHHQNALQTGISRHFGKNVTGQLKYGFFSYNEPSPAAGANNCIAHSVFGTMTFSWP